MEASSRPARRESAACSLRWREAVSAPAKVDTDNPNTPEHYDALFGGRYHHDDLSFDVDYEAGGRMEWYRRVASDAFFSAAGRYLDVGCGPAGLFTQLPPGERKLFGIDFSDVAIERAKARVQGYFIVGRAEELPYPDAYFDRISCTETLEHVDDPQLVIASMAQKLAPGGKLFITVPEETRDLHDHEWPGGVSFHVNKFNIGSLATALSGAGLLVENAHLDEREIWMVAHKPAA